MKVSFIQNLKNKILLKDNTIIIENLSDSQKSEPRGRYVNHALFVVKPRNVIQVSKVVSLMNDEKIGIIPYSGGTGLVGGQLASEGENSILLSLDKMNKIRNFSSLDNVLTVEAGVILSKIHDYAKEKKRIFPLSLASEGSCQIGGNLATNAGGINVIKYGNARDLCLGVEAVLPDGSIYNGLKSLIKDNTGYDIKNLLIGSEGTLGVITAASLKLYPKPEKTCVSLICMESFDIALNLYNHLFEKLNSSINAFEIMNKNGLEFLERAKIPFRDPFKKRSEWILLVELTCSFDDEVEERFYKLLNEFIEKNLIEDVLFAQNERQRLDFWEIREKIPEANRIIGSVSSHDISLPLSNLSSFFEIASKKVVKFSKHLLINCFGHLGDGNLHFNVFPTYGKKKEEFDYLKDDLKNEIYDVVNQLNGSISAEHGIGKLKILDLYKYSGQTKMEIMLKIKNALDPNGIMNPNKVVSKEIIYKYI